MANPLAIPDDFDPLLGRRVRLPQTPYEFPTVVRRSKRPPPVVDTVSFNLIDKHNVAGVPLLDVAGWAVGGQVDEGVTETMVGGSDEIFDGSNLKLITLNVQWPSYGYNLNKDLPVYRKGKYITRAHLAADICTNVLFLMMNFQDVSRDGEKTEWTIDRDNIRPEHMVLVSITPLHGKVFRVDLDVSFPISDSTS